MGSTVNRKELFRWRGKLHRGFLIIQNHDLHAGFGALLIYALNGIRKAESMSTIPVIDFNDKNCPYFFDAKKGNQVWEYFFEKTSPYSYEEVRNWVLDGTISEEKIHFIDASEAAKSHQHDPDRLATFWAWQEPEDKALWMNEKRSLGRKYIQEYINPQSHILEKVTHFVETRFKSDLIIGLHIRGTDFAYAKPTPLEAYFNEIDEQIRSHGQANYQVYVATDQQQYLEAFKERYSDKVVHLDAVRSENHIAPFRFEQISGYQKGEEVLMDILILSQCHHIIKGAAATGELASWFCTHNNISDFAILSEFNKRPYSKLESTYSQLNIDQKSKLRRTTHVLHERMIRRFIESKIGKAIYYRSALARKILKH
ncbi:hypothetical protein [Roseivirga sp.]|uniref:hypothetical protein n=1 Tax=Roseivirga sp. TaxID=1964215 RepID=UPI003B5238D3